MNNKTPEQKAEDDMISDRMNELHDAYLRGYKAAKEEDNKKLLYAAFRANEWKRLAREWEVAHDILKNTYDPGVLEYGRATPPTKEAK